MLVMVRYVYTYGTECVAGVQDPHSKGVTGRYPYGSLGVLGPDRGTCTLGWGLQF